MDRESQRRLEADLLEIQNMSLEALKKLYLQALQTNRILEESLALQKDQLAALHELFASGEDGVIVQKEIMRLVSENASHPVRDLMADKGADLVVAAVLTGIELWLNGHGMPTV